MCLLWLALFRVSHCFPGWIRLWSVLNAVSAEVACQKRRIVGHHACGPHFQRISYVIFLVAHKQLHLQLIVVFLSKLCMCVYILCIHIYIHIDVYIHIQQWKNTIATKERRGHFKAVGSYINYEFTFKCIQSHDKHFLFWTPVVQPRLINCKPVASLHYSVLQNFFLHRYVRKTKNPTDLKWNDRVVWVCNRNRKQYNSSMNT